MNLKKAAVVIIWGIAFGFVEASVVEYLRAIYYPISDGGFHFPIQTLAQLQSMGPEHIHRLEIEVVREFFTLVMLATIAIAAARNRRQAWAYFMIAFGVWDIFYYIWLKVLLDWPAGLMTWDLLFLLPVPWVSPVAAPVIISLSSHNCRPHCAWFRGQRPASPDDMERLDLDSLWWIYSDSVFLLGLQKHHGRRVPKSFPVETFFHRTDAVNRHIRIRRPQAPYTMRSDFLQ